MTIYSNIEMKNNKSRISEIREKGGASLIFSFLAKQNRVTFRFNRVEEEENEERRTQLNGTAP